MNNKYNAQTLTRNPTWRCQVLAFRALNMSCSFDQSARSIESRCVVKEISGPDTVRPIISSGEIDGLMQERRNSIANALELRLSCTNPSKWCDELFMCVCLLPMYLHPVFICILHIDEICCYLCVICFYRVFNALTPTNCRWSSGRSSGMVE